MVFSYVLSWFLNVVLIGVILAIIDEGNNYQIERIPEIPFLLAVGVPTFLELISFIFEQKPFLEIIWPGFSYLI